MKRPTRFDLMVAAALVVFSVDIAAAQSAVPPDTFRQDAGPMVGDDAGPEPANCPSAVARQKRLASAAEVKRMTRAAHIVTKETLAQATALAASWWERQGVAFIEDSTLRGHQHLKRAARDYDGGVGEVPRATCRALAARDAAACQALASDESAGCLAWLSLHGATQEGGSCEKVPPALRAACTLISEPGARCPEKGTPGAEACARVQASREGLDKACRLPDGETACTWAALLASLGAAPSAKACDRVRPGGDRRSPRAKRTHAFCQAVVSGAPLRCPQDTVVDQTIEVVTWIESKVIGGGEHHRLVSNLQVDRPAVCAVEVAVRLGDTVVETLTWTAVPGSKASVPDWRPLKTKASPYALSSAASALCVPRTDWGAR